jgi:hypothetical protein
MEEGSEDIPIEIYDLYEEKLLNGELEQLLSQPQDAAPQEASANEEGGERGWQADLMQKIGAKTPEEIPAKVTELRNAFSQASQKAKEAERIASNQTALMNDFFAGKPEAVAYAKNMMGKAPAVPDSTATGGSSQTEDPLSGFLLSEERINQYDDSFGARDVARDVNEMLRIMASAFNDTIAQETSGTKQFMAAMQERENAALMREMRAKSVDDLLMLAEKYSDDYELKGMPVRTLIERYVNDPSNPPAELAKLHETLQIYLAKGDRNPEFTWEDAHAIRNYGKMRGKVAEAKMGSAKPVAKPPTVGVAGSGAYSAPDNLSDQDMKAMIAGAMEIPKDWFDEDGLPIQSKMPPEVYNALCG